MSTFVADPSVGIGKPASDHHRAHRHTQRPSRLLWWPGPAAPVPTSVRMYVQRNGFLAARSCTAIRTGQRGHRPEPESGCRFAPDKTSSLAR